MKKDIEWLKERVISRKKSAELNVMAHREGLSEDFESRAIAYESVLKLIDQLDEPEVCKGKRTFQMLIRKRGSKSEKY